MYLTLFQEVLCWSLFCNVLLCVLSSFVNILTRKRERAVYIAFIVFLNIVTVDVLCLFLTVPWIGLQCVIVVFPDHIHLLLYMYMYSNDRSKCHCHFI